MRIFHTVHGCTSTLATLAEQFYGDWRMWRYLYDHNEDALEGVALHAPLPAGLVLSVPHHPRLRVTVEPIEENLTP